MFNKDVGVYVCTGWMVLKVEDAWISVVIIVGDSCTSKFNFLLTVTMMDETWNSLQRLIKNEPMLLLKVSKKKAKKQKEEGVTEYKG